MQVIDPLLKLSYLHLNSSGQLAEVEFLILNGTTKQPIMGVTHFPPHLALDWSIVVTVPTWLLIWDLRVKSYLMIILCLALMIIGGFIVRMTIGFALYDQLVQLVVDGGNVTGKQHQHENVPGLGGRKPIFATNYVPSRVQTRGLAEEDLEETDSTSFTSIKQYLLSLPGAFRLLGGRDSVGDNFMASLGQGTGRFSIHIRRLSCNNAAIEAEYRLRMQRSMRHVKDAMHGRAVRTRGNSGWPLTCYKLFCSPLYTWTIYLFHSAHLLLAFFEENQVFTDGWQSRFWLMLSVELVLCLVFLLDVAILGIHKMWGPKNLPSRASSAEALLRVLFFLDVLVAYGRGPNHVASDPVPLARYTVCLFIFLSSKM